MTKLRTLKDIKKVFKKITHKISEPDKFIEEYSRHLRWEAIEWIKYITGKESGAKSVCLNCMKSYLNCRCEKNKQLYFSFDRYEGDKNGSITILKSFFNITEEDLK